MRPKEIPFGAPAASSLEKELSADRLTEDGCGMQYRFAEAAGEYATLLLRGRLIIAPTHRVTKVRRRAGGYSRRQYAVPISPKLWANTEDLTARTVREAGPYDRVTMVRRRAGVYSRRQYAVPISPKLWANTQHLTAGRFVNRPYTLQWKMVRKPRA